MTSPHAQRLRGLARACSETKRRPAVTPVAALLDTSWRRSRASEAPATPTWVVALGGGGALWARADPPGAGQTLGQWVMSADALFVAVFLACVVEAVEAVTIVLAAGTTRDWRSALYGVGAGLALLAVIIAVLGPAVTAIPLHWLRLFVGGLLLTFGLQWLRKSILRASGYKALHDEAQIFDKQVAQARDAPRIRRGVVEDWYAFTLSFKGVVLEGLEVVFIVLTFGSNQDDVPLAAIAAGAAVVVVATVGILVRAPLARVPENTMKFVVGVMLTGFGTFWGAEGAGAVWPGSDAALLVLVPAIAVLALALVGLLRRQRRARPATPTGLTLGSP